MSQWPEPVSNGAWTNSQSEQESAKILSADSSVMKVRGTEQRKQLKDASWKPAKFALKGSMVFSLNPWPTLWQTSRRAPSVPPEEIQKEIDYFKKLDNDPDVPEVLKTLENNLKIANDRAVKLLPVKIMNMVKELHERGYTSIYLYSGMAPSGVFWRYSIGLIHENKWPSDMEITFGSIGSADSLDWATNTSSATALADQFETFFADSLKETKAGPTEYSRWYQKIISNLKEDELLEFYADYYAKHKHLLKTAPGYVHDKRN